MTTMADIPAGLYVHVPFCRQKCRYCDFYSIPSTSLVTEWLHALDQEALLYKDRFSFFDTLYLGGGTPTLLTAENLAGLVEILRRTFRLLPDAEVSLEANPNDVTLEKLHLFGILVSTGSALACSRWTTESSPSSAERIRRARRPVPWPGSASGFPGFGVDLIYGLPRQTEAEWRRTLQETLAPVVDQPQPSGDGFAAAPTGTPTRGSVDEDDASVADGTDDDDDEKTDDEADSTSEEVDDGFGDELDDDDDLDEFDDIEEDDFDDDFDDDFEEELEDDYEIEIEDEISAEFGLGSGDELEDEEDDGLDDFDDFENID